MRIGELASLTGTSARLLRYYEQQGLLKPEREPNGYRTYRDHLVDRVAQIRGLLDSGVPTRIIAQILPCLGEARQIVVDDAQPELLALLADQQQRMDERIRCLVRNRDAIGSYLDDVRRATAGTSGPPASERVDDVAAISTS